MRFIIFTICFFLVAYAIKIDLTEGTVPLAQTTPIKEEKCSQENQLAYVTVLTMEGDTVQSLIAAYSAFDGVSYQENLAHFYQLNPHLKKQRLIPGEYVKLPVYKTINEQC